MIFQNARKLIILNKSATISSSGSQNKKGTRKQSLEMKTISHDIDLKKKRIPHQNNTFRLYC